MNHISELQNIGRGERCLLVGGGHSVNSLDFHALPLDTFIISTNNHKNEFADMVIYYDKEMKEYFQRVAVPADYMLGFKNNSLDFTCEQCSHYYTYNDMIFGDTGFHALQFADKIFNFAEILLIGYDYKICNSSYHFNEPYSDPRKMNCFRKQSIGNVLNMYNKIDWKNDIYNLSKNSDLKTFSYKSLDT